MSEDEETARAERFRQAHQAQMLENLDRYRIQTEQTKSPVYVWQALAEWFAIDDLNTAAAKDRLQIPPWLLSHLSIYARRLRDLSLGLDYTQTPIPFGNLPRKPASLEQARQRQKTLTPTEATRQILAALEFRRDGSNAFKQAQRLEDQDGEVLGYEFMKELVKLPDQKATAAMLEDHEVLAKQRGLQKPSITDVRSIHRRIQKSRKAHTPKPG